MNKWAVRIAALLMLLIFALLFANLQKQLLRMKEERSAATATR
jgi:hypothetical protein